ncbi:hypothetical protein [Snodgrassella alvi]
MSKFAKEVNEAGFTTQAQERYDKSVSILNHTFSNNIGRDGIER